VSGSRAVYPSCVQDGNTTFEASGQPLTGVNCVDMGDDEPKREVRRHIRYPVHTAVTFKWSSLDGTEYRGKGSSRDISEGGAYIVTRVCPPLRSTIGIIIRFVALSGVARPFILEFTGRVVRIEPLLHSKQHWGFAVASKQPILQETNDFHGSPPLPER